MTAHPKIDGLSAWRPLARGGVAVVWQAHQAVVDRHVAVKVYELGWQQDDPRHFVREAMALEHLASHPGIVTPYAVGRLPDKRPYLVMELCPGGSLTRWLEPTEQPGQERVREVGVRIADVLAAAHAAGLVHGDVKPGNILIDSVGAPRLADFGSAVERGTACDPADPRWVSPDWAPPEVLRGEPATEAGDVFSLAATLHALLAGSPSRPPGPVPGASPALVRVLLDAMADDPAARPSAATFFSQLARVPLHAPRHRGRGLRTPVLAAVAAGAAVVVASTASWVGSRPAASDAPAPAAPVSSVAVSTVDEQPSAEQPSAASSAPARGQGAIRLAAPVEPAKAFRTAQLRGRYPDGAGTRLRVQRWEKGAWRTFPVPLHADEAGEFTAYVELGQPGRYRLRVLDPRSGASSDPVVLMIEH